MHYDNRNRKQCRHLRWLVRHGEKTTSAQETSFGATVGVGSGSTQLIPRRMRGDRLGMHPGGRFGHVPTARPAHLGRKKVMLDHQIFTRWPAQYPDRLQLFSAPTPNGVKVGIMLEE